MQTKQIDLIINKLSKAKYLELSAAQKINPDELYFVNDDTINANDQKIVNVAQPTDDADAANKQYVDGEISKIPHLSTATSLNLGGIRIGYSTANHNYAVQLDENDKAFVNVPWTDLAISSARYDSTTKQIVLVFNDTTKTAISVSVADLVDTYTAGYGLKLVNNQFSISANFAEATDLINLQNSLSDYYTKSQTDALSDSFRSGLATTDSLSSYVTKTEYASDIDTLSNDTSGKIVIDDTYAKSLELKHVSVAEYAQLLTTGTLSNCLYIISGDYDDAYGQQVKNVADPTEPQDAVTKNYLETHTISAHQSLSEYAKSSDVANQINGLSSQYLQLNPQTDTSITTTKKLTFSNGQVETEFTGGYWNFKGNGNGLNFEKGTYNSFESGSHIELDGELCCASFNNIVDSVGNKLANMLNSKVPNVRSINGQQLTSDIILDIPSLCVDGTVTNEFQFNHVSLEEYAKLLSTNAVISNALYVISSDNNDAYGQRIINVADPIELCDATNKQYVDNAICSNVPTRISELSNDVGYTSNTGTITGVIMNGSYKGTSGVVNLGTVLTSHQSLTQYATKTYVTQSISSKVPTTRSVNGQQLTSDIYIDVPQLCVDGQLTSSIQLNHISLTDYAQMLSAGTALSNSLYVVSSDNNDSFGQRIVNVGDPVDDTDAVNKQYVDQIVGNVDTILRGIVG